MYFIFITMLQSALNEHESHLMGRLMAEKATDESWLRLANPPFLPQFYCPCTLVSNFSWIPENLTPSSRPGRWSQSRIILHTTMLQSATCSPKWPTGSKVYV